MSARPGILLTLDVNLRSDSLTRMLQGCASMAVVGRRARAAVDNCSFRRVWITSADRAAQGVLPFGPSASTRSSGWLEPLPIRVLRHQMAGWNATTGGSANSVTLLVPQLELWRSPLAKNTVVVTPKRETWNTQTAFLISAIGSAIGLGNIWRFPGVAYESGGGAFIVPYIVALLLIGLPVLFLDYAIGHKYKGTPPLALRRLAPKGEWLGWFQVGVSFIIFTYYAVVIAWAAHYVIYSVNEAWGEDPTTFFVTDFLQATEAESAFSLNPVAAVAIPLVLIWILALFIMARGIQDGIAAANKIFLPLLVILFIAMVVRALFLPGAIDGLNAFFTPEWGALANPSVWLAAVAQIFYSLSVAFGIMMTYASYLKKNANLTGAGLVAGFANSSFEILAGIGVFAALGFMAFGQGVQISDLEGLSGVTLSFMTFPRIISMMPGGPLFGVLFFSSLLLAGFTSLVSLLQVVSGALQDKFGLSVGKATLIMGLPAMVISVIIFGTKTGLNALDVVDAFINNLGVVGSAVMLTLFVAIRKKLPILRAYLNKVSSVRLPKAWDYVVGIVAPIALSVMLISAIVDFIRQGYGGMPTWYIAIFGWGAIALAIVFALVMTAFEWRVNKFEDEEPMVGGRVANVASGDTVLVAGTAGAGAGYASAANGGAATTTGATGNPASLVEGESL